MVDPSIGRMFIAAVKNYKSPNIQKGTISQKVTVSKIQHRDMTMRVSSVNDSELNVTCTVSFLLTKKV